MSAWSKERICQDKKIIWGEIGVATIEGKMIRVV